MERSDINPALGMRPAVAAALPAKGKRVTPKNRFATEDPARGPSLSRRVFRPFFRAVSRPILSKEGHAWAHADQSQRPIDALHISAPLWLNHARLRRHPSTSTPTAQLVGASLRALLVDRPRPRRRSSDSLPGRPCRSARRSSRNLQQRVELPVARWDRWLRTPLVAQLRQLNHEIAQLESALGITSAARTRQGVELPDPKPSALKAMMAERVSEVGVDPREKSPLESIGLKAAP